jgi:hypothetical protein
MKWGNLSVKFGPAGGFRGEGFQKLNTQKQEVTMATMFVN